MEKSENRRHKLIGIAFPTMVSCRVLGAAISPLLFAHLPVLLIIMSPFLVHLVFVAPLVGPAVYFPVALSITIMQALVGFHFGSEFGQRALGWLLARVPVSRELTERVLDLVYTASIPAIFAIPGPIMGTVAGVAKVPKKTFFFLVAPAQAIWVTAAYFVGEALLEYIEVIRNFVIAHAFTLTGLTISVVALRWGYGQFKRKKI